MPDLRPRFLASCLSSRGGEFRKGLISDFDEEMCTFHCLHVLLRALQMPARRSAFPIVKGIRTLSLLPTNAFIAFEDVVGST